MASRVLDVIEAAERALIAIIVAALRRGIHGPSWEDQKLAEVQILRHRLQAGVQQLDAQVVEQVTQIVHDAYNRGQALAVIDLEDAALPFNLATDAAQAAENAARSAVDSTRAALYQLPEMLLDVYQQAVRAGAAEVLAGTADRVQAAQHVLDDLASRGVTGFKDKAGRNWSLESYVEMNVRTGAGHAAIQGHVDALQASGMDLVIVLDAPRECPLCRPWERKVLSLSGVVGAVIEPSAITGNPVTVHVAGTLEAARAAGLFHPNCRHTLSRFTPGVTVKGQPKSDPAGYEATQRQREIERKIREWKRREQVALDDQAARRARAKVREWQAAQRAHVEENDLQRLSRREQIGKAI